MLKPQAEKYLRQMDTIITGDIQLILARMRTNPPASERAQMDADLIYWYAIRDRISKLLEEMQDVVKDADVDHELLRTDVPTLRGQLALIQK